jgi:hypothetical protein
MPLEEVQIGTLMDRMNGRGTLKMMMLGTKGNTNDQCSIRSHGILIPLREVAYYKMKEEITIFNR